MCFSFARVRVALISNIFVDFHCERIKELLRLSHLNAFIERQCTTLVPIEKGFLSPILMAMSLRIKFTLPNVAKMTTQREKNE